MECSSAASEYDGFLEQRLHTGQSYQERLDRNLEQFTDYQQYDKFLSTLESLLSQSKPRVLCPSKKSIQLLLTLSTIDWCNRGDFIKKEIHFFTSHMPLRHRANAILSGMCDILMSETVEEWDQTDIEIMRTNLIGALDFIKSKHRVIGRAATKRKYKEIAPSLPEGSPDISVHQSDINNGDELDKNSISPSKRAMLNSFEDLDNSLAQGIELGELHTGVVSDDKILGSLPIEELLISDKIWEVIKYMLSCSNSNDQAKLKFWEIWEASFNNIFNIIDLDLQHFKKLKKENKNRKLEKNMLFRETLLSHFISANFNSNWENGFVQLLMVPHDPRLSPFQKQDLQLCNGQLLTDIIPPSKSKLVNKQNYKFIRKIITEAFEALRHHRGIGLSDQWRESTFLIQFARSFISKAKYPDFEAMFIVTLEDTQNKNVLIILLKLTIALIEALSNSKDHYTHLRKFDDYLWLKDQSEPTLIIYLFKKISIFNNTPKKETALLLDELQKLNFLLFKVLEIWIKVNFYPYQGAKKLPDAIVIELLEAAKVGDRLRTKDLANQTNKSKAEDIIEEHNKENKTKCKTLFQSLQSQLGNPKKEQAEIPVTKNNESPIDAKKKEAQREAESEYDDTEAEIEEEVTVLNETIINDSDDDNDTSIEIISVTEIRRQLSRPRKVRNSRPVGVELIEID